MERVNIYTYTTIKGPGTKSGTYTYILEYITKKGPATLTMQGELEEVTEHQAHLKMLTEAAGRLKKPCEIVLYTDSAYIQRGIDSWMENWISAGWVNARGKPVANMDEWKRVAELLEHHTITFETGTKHSYSSWLQMETEKKEKERRKCLKDSENLTALRK